MRGEGKRNKTIKVPELPSKSPSWNGYASTKNLSNSDLGGVIFGCKHSTMAECLSKQLFGLPSSHFSYVRNIKQGLPLFLFNYSDRKMHGIYEAASPGEMNIDPYAWTSDGQEKTKFPAQVRIHIRIHCQPIMESQFRKTIGDNYYQSQCFWFELDHVQTNSLIALFTASPISLNSMSPVTSGKTHHFEALTTTTAIAKSKKEYRRLDEAKKHSKSLVDLVSVHDIASFDSDNEDTGCGGLSKTSSCPAKGEHRESLTACDDLGKVNVPQSNSNVSLYQDRENKILSKQQIDGQKLEIEELGVTSKMLKKLSFDPEYSTPSEICDDVTSVPCLSGEMQEETMLAGKSSDLVEEENITTFNQYHGNPECMNIIKELKGRTTALEKRQVESVQEIEQMRHVVKDSSLKVQQLENRIEELESKLLLLMGSESLIYLIGGYDGNSWLSSLDVFSPSVDMLKPLKSLSAPRSYASSAALYDNIYVFGGGDGSSLYNTVECYNQKTNEWTVCSPLSCAKRSLAGTTLNDKIFALGGGNGFENFSDVEVFDPALDRWIFTNPMLYKRFAPAAADLHGALYAVGGFNGDDFLQSGERFDPRVGYWERLPDAKLRRGCPSAAILNEKLYVMGGHDGSTAVSSVEIFDPRLGSWMMGEPMNFARGYGAAAVLADSLFVIGGADASDQIIETVECYKEGIGWAACGYTSIGKRCFFSAVVP
ncbi:kelch-like protein 8 [Iris pallida]|uniref:Kelch-like protein 8 n=1 Tax=Iris pallida TaxID=29817 RepID=A0AAX6I1Z6_IRIPA|nr:kelch-like protein 8 [Iris pallida]